MKNNFANLELVVFDVDGTILDPEGELPEDVAGMLKSLRQTGRKIALATGRSLQRVRHLAVRIDSRMPLILLNGAWVHDMTLSQDCLALNLDRKIAAEVLKLLREWGFDIILQKGIPESHIFYYERENAGNIEFSGRIERNFDRCRRVPDLLEIIEHEDPGEITLLDTTDKILAVKARLEDAGLDIGISYSTSFINKGFSWLELLHQDATKGKALKFLARYMGLERENIAAVGDNYNDVDMLEWAGIGIAVGSAEAGVKEIADIVLPDNGRGVLNLQELLHLSG